MASEGRLSGAMSCFYLKDAAALGEVTALMRIFGEEACGEAAARADHSRNVGNVLGFCHWRQIARAIAMLSDEDVTGTVH